MIPQPVEIGRIPTKDHGVSSGPVMVVDTQTLLVPEFTYDGLGPGKCTQKQSKPFNCLIINFYLEFAVIRFVIRTD